MQTPEEHMGDLVRAYEEARQPLTLSPYAVQVDHGVIAVLGLIRARDAEVAAKARAEALAGFTEWFAPAYTAPNGNTCPLGPETVAREYAETDARDMASPEDETPVYVARRLVGPWEPIPDD